MKNDIFDKITPDEALVILKEIAKTDKKLKMKIIELADDLFRNVDIETICDEVFYALDGITGCGCGTLFNNLIDFLSNRY